MAALLLLLPCSTKSHTPISVATLSVLQSAGPVPGNPLSISIALQDSSQEGGGAAQSPKLNKNAAIVVPPRPPLALVAQRN